MGRGLYDSEPVFRRTMDRAAEVLAPLLERPLFEVLYPTGDAATPIHDTGYTQPALFALELALAELLRSWGISPAVVVGHSVGEYAAACVAGVFSMEDGLALIAERGRLMSALPAGGAMAAIFAGEAKVAARIHGHTDRLAIAGVNGPEETVISGDADAVAEVVAAFAADEVGARQLEVSHAFHSPRLDPMLDALERRAATVAHNAPRRKLISNLSGTAFAAGRGPDARYWRRHAREPVRFADCVEALHAAGVTALVEIGPHPTLIGLTGRARPSATWTPIAPLRRGRADRREALDALGKLYCLGATVSWDALSAPQSRRRSLPTYPFQRQRYWVDATPAAAARPPTAGHPLLGERRELAEAPDTSVWQRELSLATHPWLRDHRVQDAAIVPATAYIEMALAAARELLGAVAVSVREIENLKPLILHDGQEVVVQATLRGDASNGAHFRVHSRAVGKTAWTAHMSARIARTADAAESGRAAVDAARARSYRTLDGRAFYAALAAKGNGWGPCFQGLQEAWIGEGEAVGRIAVAPVITDRAAGYAFHPAVSDACGHVLVATVPEDRATGAFVGGGVGEVRFHRPPRGSTLWAHARLKPAPDPGARVVVGDVFVYDDAGALVSETLDARLWYLDEADSWAYQVEWRERDRGDERVRPAGNGPWLVFTERGDLAQAIAAHRDGAAAVWVRPGDAYSLDGTRATVRAAEPADLAELLAAVGRPGAILFLSDAGDANAAPEETVLQLLHGLRAAGGAAGARLWLLTRGSQAAVPGDACAWPRGACLWGLGRTLSVEHAELWGGLIDVDDLGGDVAALLVREIERGAADDKIALRAGRRYVPRICRRRARGADLPFAPRSDATHLITGGLGGIGLAMARWLVERGAHHLLLVGRTAPKGPKRAAVTELESMGARVEAAALDIAGEGALEACLEARRARGEPPVCGVIHAAGILQFEALASQELSSLRASLAAKVLGAQRLHTLFCDQALDYFAMCSSSSALLPSPLLGGYAAGNAFLDALAHHRRALGLAGLSVNWGTWGEVGMAVDQGRSANGQMIAGMGTIPTARGLAMLRDFLAAGDTQAAVLPVDWPKLADAYPTFAVDRFFTEMVGDRAAQPAATGPSPLTALREAPEAERRGVLAAYLRQHAARVLGMALDGLDPAVPLSSMGFDSLMAVQLKNQIEADLRAVVPMIEFLQGPSIVELAPSVLEAVELRPVEPGNADDPAADTWEEGSI
jgi:acyl transferase domain-containing protein